MYKKISENASTAATGSGSIAVVSTPLNHHKPITRSGESSNSTKYSNTPTVTVYQGDKSVNR